SHGLEYLEKVAFMESVYNAKFKKLPDDFKVLSQEEISQFKTDPYASPWMPKQEKGIKPSNGLSYQLYADGVLNADKNAFGIRFESSDQVFGKKTLGSPFNVYAPGRYIHDENGVAEFKDLRTWAFAVKPADQVSAIWPLNNFENGIYHLRVYGPNGFFREFKGSVFDPMISIRCAYQQNMPQKLTGNIDLTLSNQSDSPMEIEVVDHSYGNPSIKRILAASSKKTGKMIVSIQLSKQFGWYDFSVKVTGSDLFEKRYAGRVETGESGYSDPFMGRMI
ncbi:MAG TPA: phospholipase domain-containing protein, partial [Puia sp.]